MAQQMVNGSYYNGSETMTYRMSDRYAVVNPPFAGAHGKPQDEESLERRHEHWEERNKEIKRAYRETDRRRGRTVRKSAPHKMAS